MCLFIINRDWVIPPRKIMVLRGAEHPFFSQRAEQLSVADFVALTQWVEQRIGG